MPVTRASSRSAWIKKRHSSERARSALLRQIDLLIRRRQALITAAVMGELAIAGIAA